MERLAGEEVVDVRERRRRVRERAELEYLRRVALQECESAQRELEEREKEALESAQKSSGETHGHIEDLGLHRVEEKIDRSAEVKAVAAGIWEEFNAREYDDGYGKSNPFRMHISRDNCASLGMADYFDRIQLSMSYQAMGEKVKNETYPDLKTMFADLTLIVNNCLIYNPDGRSPVRKAGMELGKQVKACHKKHKKHRLFDQAKFKEGDDGEKKKEGGEKKEGGGETGEGEKKTGEEEKMEVEKTEGGEKGGQELAPPPPPA
ncbi:hypothetical protein TeGR_g14455 [Tetraparma gracilis]|uniref:Bromo domain-containing protein n=1 Tax=Tetraparma gracilis TaxID=2962635 RepID=A0ABQ6N0D9_9STRA|nr:hypothetical protein TeGR_g14455 [Tetraparma gracilis]